MGLLYVLMLLLVVVMTFLHIKSRNIKIVASANKATADFAPDAT